jgi:trk system potassium uptake protein TrkH
VASRVRALARLRRQPVPPALRIVLGLVALVASGTLLLMLPLAGGSRPLRWNEALFTATSALSVTGLVTITPATDLSRFGHVVLLLLIQLGGVGFMVGAVVVLRILGRRIGLTDRIALSDSLGLLSPAAIISLSSKVLITVLVIELLGAGLLFVHWRADPRLSEGEALFFALFHAVSAFCNAGLELFTGTPGYPTGSPRDNLSLAIMGTLIFVGGLGIPVVAELLAYWRERRLSLHTRLTLKAVVFLVIAGTIGFFVVERRSDGVLAALPLFEQLIVCLFQSVSARSGGFQGIAEFTALQPASQLLMMTLMFIGGAPASMGGGISTGTFVALAASFWGYVRGYPTAQIGGRALAVGTVRRAGAVLFVSLFVVLLTTWLLLVTHDTTLDLATFEIVSAFATCGLTLGLTGELNLFGQLLVCLMMFWGRLGALTIIVALANRQGRSGPVQYPEEQILIG